MPRPGAALAKPSTLLAVSDQNVMLLVALVVGVAMVLGVSLRPRLFIALVLVLAYVPLAGGGPSIQRAGVMGAAGLVAALAGRATARWYALLLAAAVTLAASPLAAEDPGWQLSFAAVIALLAGAGPLSRLLTRWRLPRPLAEVTAITVLATIATAPLLAHHFGELSLVSLPANVLAAPAVAPVMWLGMTVAAAAQVDPALAAPLTAINVLLVAYIEWVAHAAAATPHATVALELSGRGLLVALAAVVGALALFSHPRVKLRLARWSRVLLGRGASTRSHLRLAAAMAAVVALAALGWVVTSGARAPELAADEVMVSFLDVGQGDATLVQTRGTAMLVDTGPPDGPVLERLAEAGVSRLDTLVVTHAQADHEGAAAAVIERLRPRLVINGGAGWPTATQKSLRSAGTHVVAAHAGQRVSLGAIEMEALWPPPDETPDITRDPNELALVLHLRHGDFDLLLPADAESGVLARLDLPRVEALKVSHHGSEDPGLPAILERIRPAVAAIEVGRDNSYGHPAPSTLDALRVVPDVFRTDRDGTVRLRARHGSMWVER